LNSFKNGTMGDRVGGEEAEGSVKMFHKAYWGVRRLGWLGGTQSSNVKRGVGLKNISFTQKKKKGSQTKDVMLFVRRT